VATEKYKGIFKVTEEAGEVIQLAGKLAVFPEGVHPDGRNLRTELMNELADLQAAMMYMNFEFTPIELAYMQDRIVRKLVKFCEWGLTGVKE